MIEFVKVGSAVAAGTAAGAADTVSTAAMRVERMVSTWSGSCVDDGTAKSPR